MSSTPEVIGKYRIERFLASGGMGDIYLGRDPMLDRPVAIKLLREGFDSDELRERFEREARSAGRLSHTNIVTIYEFGLFQERPFIAMEYVPGESLAAIIRRREPLPITRKLELIEGLCAGLAHAHRANIVHRDIKPANLIVDADGGLKVLDFGIVKLAGSGLTHHGVLVGTVNYMSPEQIAGAPDGVDHRSDVFAVGAVFYELLAYQRAFPGQMAEVLYKIVHASPDPLSHVCPGIDPAIEQCVNKCLDRDTDRRYQDLNVLRRELTRIRQRIDLEHSPDQRSTTGETLVLNTPSHSGSAGVPALTPDRLSALIVSAQVALDARDLDRALVLCEHAAAIDPDDLRVRELQRTAQAAREAQRVEALLSEASGHLEAQRLVEARVAIDFVVAAQPDSAAAIELRERLDRAVAEEERRRDWARRFGAAMNRARAELERGALQEASAAIDEALTLNPENSGAVTLRQRIAAALALEQEQLRREQEARLQQREARVTSARTALAGDDLTAADAALGEAEQLGAGEDLAALRTDIEARRQALQRAADRVRAGEARLERGDLETASRLVNEALAIKRDLPHATALRSRVDRAIEERRKRHAWLHSRFDSGREALRQGQFDVALECLEQVRQAEPAWPGVSDLIAEAGRQKAAEIERRRREEELASLLGQATDAHARQDLEAARAHVDAMLRLDHAFAPALALSAQIEEAFAARRAEEARRRAAEERKRRREQMAHARDAFSAGRVDEALSVLGPLANAAQTEPGFNELLQQVRAEHERLEAEQRRLRERAQRIAAALDRARQQLDAGAFGPATAAADEALALDPEHTEALEVRQRIGAAVERHVDGLIQAAGAQVAKERHQRGIEILERAGLTHPRLDAELERIRKAAEALALERRVDEVLAGARGRFRKRSPADVLNVLEQSGLQHPRIAQEMQAARQAIAEAAAREAEAARAREEKARQASLRAEQERAERARAEQERAEKARAEKAAAEQAAAERARAEKARADQVRAQRASAEAAAAKARAAKADTKAHRAQSAGVGTTVQTARAGPAAEQPARPQWQKLAALAVAAILVLVVGVLVARRFWLSSPAPVRAQNDQPATLPPAPDPNPPSAGPASSNPDAAAPPSPVSVPPEPATTTATPAERAKSLASRILQLAGQEDRQGALAAAVEANAQLGNEPIVRDALARLARAARADAESSRANARKVNAHERDAPGFAAADGTFQTAQRESQRGRALDAVRHYWEAEGLFGQAAARAATAQAQPQPTPQPPSETRPGPEPQPAGSRVDAPRAPEPAPPSPAPAAQPPVSTPPTQQPSVQPPPIRQPDTPAFDPRAVQSTLDAYANAYSSLNVDNIARVFPNLPAAQREGLSKQFSQVTQFELTWSGGACKVEPLNPTVAEANCTANWNFRFKDGRRGSRQSTLNFRVERRGASWVIAQQR